MHCIQWFSIHYFSFHGFTRYLKIDTHRKTYFRQSPISFVLFCYHLKMETISYLFWLVGSMKGRHNCSWKGSLFKQLSKVAKKNSFGTRVSNIDNFEFNKEQEKFVPPRELKKVIVHYLKNAALSLDEFKSLENFRRIIRCY